MNSQIHNFLVILNKALHQNICTKTIELQEPIDWEVMSMQARKQNLLPLFVEGAQEYAAYCAYSGYGQDLQDAMVMVARQVQKTKAFLDVYKIFLEAGVRPVVLKGIEIRQLYGSYRDHRVSGDEDILIPLEEYESIRSILEQEGYRCTRPTLTKQQIAQVHEVTFYNAETDLSIEVHLNIIGKENAFRDGMNDLFQSVDETESIEVDGIELCVMNPTQSFLYLVLHGFKHFLLGGMGIRPMLDMLLYRAYYQEQMDYDTIKRLLKVNHAALFLQDMIWIGHQFFGLSIEKDMPICCPEELLEDLMQTGIFGGSEKTDYLAANIRMSTSYDRTKQGKIKTLLAGAFPPIGQLIEPYPYLVEKPWLLPVVWIKRFMKFGKSNGKDMIFIVRETVKKANQREDILRKYMN